MMSGFWGLSRLFLTQTRSFMRGLTIATTETGTKREGGLCSAGMNLAHSKKIGRQVGGLGGRIGGESRALHIDADADHGDEVMQQRAVLDAGGRSDQLFREG